MKVLVIRLKYIGDTLLSLPLCRSIKNSYPDAEVHYLMYEPIAPLYQNDEGLEPGIDALQVITAEEKKKPAKYLKKLHQLRRERYDIVIDTLTVPATVLISRFTGAERIIGFDKGKARSNWYTHKIPHVPNVSSLKQKLQLLNGMPDPVTPVTDMQLHFSTQEQHAIRQKLSNHGVDLDRPLILLSPIARLRIKLWPEAYFVELGRWLLDDYSSRNGNDPDMQLLIAWGPGEQQQAKTIKQKIQQASADQGRKARVFCDIKTSDVRELAALASQCQLYIGNDTGPRHIAEAAGIPTFTIFSPLFSKQVWIPNPGPQHQAIDISDVLDIGFDDHLLNIPSYADNLEHYYAMITPEIVSQQLQPLLDSLLDNHTSTVTSAAASQ